MKHRAPNVIIPGAQKSGSTSLCAALDAHPQCVVSRPKEPNFFCRAENETRLPQLATFFVHAGERATVAVDGTTSYMADARVAPRIRRLLGPDVKIVFTLRNPSRRTYSAYLHMLKRGHERRTPEEVFLDLPDEPNAARTAEHAAVEAAARAGQVVARPYRRLYDDVLWNFRYYGNSCFRHQVACFDEQFAPENILILLFEDMVTDFEAVGSRLTRFLDIASDSLPAILPRRNETRTPDTSTLFGILYEQARRIKHHNFVLVRRQEGKMPPNAPPNIAAKLAELLLPETRYWSERLGRDLSDIGW